MGVGFQHRIGLALSVAFLLALGSIAHAGWSDLDPSSTWFIVGEESGLRALPDSLFSFGDDERAFQRGYWENDVGGVVIGACKTKLQAYFKEEGLDVGTTVPTWSQALQDNAKSIRWGTAVDLVTTVGPAIRQPFTLHIEKDEWCEGFVVHWEPWKQGHRWQMAGYICASSDVPPVDQRLDAVLSHLGFAGQFESLLPTD